MNCFKNVYLIFYSFFKYLFLKRKESLYIVNDIENPQELGNIISDKSN
jgi:hypothetical protein